MEKSNSKTPRVAMIQDGARRRYVVPLALQEAGILERAYIDWFVGRGSVQEMIARLVAQVRPHLGRKMLERSCPRLDSSRVIENAALALRLRMCMPRFETAEDAYIWASRQTAKWILRKGFGRANCLYGFIRNAAPEAYREAKRLGLGTAGDQIIAPLDVEVAEMKRQLARWPGWNDREAMQIHPAYSEFERDTWESLDRITCMSEYVRDGLVSVGINKEKIEVIPYPWIGQPEGHLPRGKRSGRLVVGFVGEIGLRKGAPWFLETAKRFDPSRVEFVMVGNMRLDASKLEPFAGRVEFARAVPRSGVRSWLQRFDVFFFPSTCEGSAGAVMEAMGSGLPIITTPNSGSRVRDGVDGVIRPYDDVDGFEQAIRRFDDDRDVLVQMGIAARERVESYGLEAYHVDLKQFFEGLIRSA